MRVLHITEYCHAGTIGGTERYILDLIRGLDAGGIQNIIGWLKPGHTTETLESEGVRIITLPAPPMRVDAPLPEFHQAAERLLETEKPDCLHFHTFGLTEAALAKLAHKRGIPYAFTYHSPAWTCRRETLLRYGREQCHGEARAWGCSACQSEERLGMGPFAGHVATAISMAAGWMALPLGKTPLRRRLAFFYDSLRFRRVLRSFLAECDLVISCCDWSGPVLRRNGARENCMVQCPQGIPNAVADMLRTEQGTTPSTGGQEFVVGYIGRMTSVKGVDILAEGFCRAKAPHARLKIFGWEGREGSDSFARKIKALAETDNRIELRPKLPLDAMAREYQALNLVAIPSVFMETGPLVLLEALALGVPVYGSNRIGQINLLQQFGKVIEPNTPEAWGAAIADAADKHQRGQWPLSMSKNANGVMTMRDVAQRMAERYKLL